MMFLRLIAIGSIPFKVRESAAGESVYSFFRRLLNADFMPHGHCYFWQADILWLQVLSNAAIAVAYFSIPAMVFYFIRKRRDLPFHWMFYLFGSFILCCGITHVLDALVIWYPIYRLDSAIRAITATVSVLTAILLFPLIPKALALRSARELEIKNQELDLAYQQLVASEKLKDEFIARISHELRTPLTLIIAPVESMLERRDRLDDERECLQVVHNNSVRLLRMVNELLDFSKLEAGKFEVKRQPTDVAALTRSLFADFKASMDAKRIECSLKIDVDHAVVDLDRYLFERIVFNLLSNAVKFTPEKGAIQVSLLVRGELLTLKVQDSGIGISKEEQTFVFEKFRQIDSTATRRFEGAGLGLALAKEFVSLLGGKIVVESTEGKGSIFIVEFLTPRSASETEDVRGQYSPPRGLHKVTSVFLDQRGRKDRTQHGSCEKLGKVLIAEDNAELADYVSSLLMDSCDIQTASNGEEAFALAKKWHPDLLLSDVMMPRMDGFTLCKAIKNDNQTASIAVILLTALTYRDALIKGWECGADEYLFKPFHPRELVTRVKSMLRLTSERRLKEAERVRRQELEEFSHLASHDLKEPLRIITTYSQLIQKRYLGQLGSEADTFINFVVNSSVRMQRLLDGLIHYSRLSREVISLEAVSSESALKKAMARLSVSIEETQAQITIDTLPEVLGNLMEIETVFLSLIENALKFRTSAPPRIHISAKRLKGEWLFSVRDNGIGFDRQYAEQIFLIFKRLHDEKQVEGTGMGLAICRKIIQRHKGRIWAEPFSSGGSIFYFTLLSAQT